MTSTLLEKTAETKLKTTYGTFEFMVYREQKSKKEHIVLLKPFGKKVPLVRIHSECATGDIFSSEFCDCGPQLDRSLKRIAKDGGIIIYLRQEGRGLGLTNKIKAYELQRQGADTMQANLLLGFAADGRDYGIAVEILRDLKISSLLLLTNNPHKVDELKHAGLVVVRVPLIVKMLSRRGKKYLKTKREKMGHLFGKI